nr:ribonuclease H-like domain-containing protein [Tanacetum cinerariifolium]
HTPPSDENEHLAFNVQLSPTKPKQDLPTTSSVLIIEDWVSDSEEADLPQVTNDVPSLAQKLAQNSYATREIHKHNAPMKYSRIPLHKVTTAARTIGAARPTYSKTRPHIVPYTVSKSKPPIRRPFIRHTSPKPSISPPRVNAANPSAVSVARVNAARPSAVSAARINAVKPSAVTAVQQNHTKKGNPHQALKDKGGKIMGKGKIKTGKLDFDDVYYVKELKFNLFSVSQMRDKKNNVLFTDTECLVLSSDFKLPDASQVLLRVLRENNMYNVNLKNIILSGDLTYLFAKATLDKSNLWHRRLVTADGLPALILAALTADGLAALTRAVLTAEGLAALTLGGEMLGRSASSESETQSSMMGALDVIGRSASSESETQSSMMGALDVVGGMNVPVIGGGTA